jgi:hypothetical protein
MFRDVLGAILSQEVWDLFFLASFCLRLIQLKPVTVAEQSRHALASSDWTLGSWVRMPLET